jgi:N-acetyl-gamma-glutamyl-phosphate reductase
MINVGILGGTGPVAGELIRILINHPDVMLRQVCEPELAGCDIKSQHHGLIGESNKQFVGELDLLKLDVLFVNTQDHKLRRMIPTVDDAPDLCVIELAENFTDARIADPFVVYGVPEMNRKPLVRGARRAVIPPAAETLMCIALLPLAMHSMLPESLSILLECNEALASVHRVDIENVQEQMRVNGNDPAPAISVSFSPSDDRRAMRVSFVLDLPLPLDNIFSMYEDLYDDHNLTHVVSETVSADEVEGTDKCVISLDKTADGRLSVQAIADAGLRGGAGDAVHVMNLLKGLYEKTGLALKASNL